MVLEKELRGLILIHRQQEVNCHTRHGLSMYETSKPSSIVTVFLQQGHTCSHKATPTNKVTPLNTVTSYGPIKIHESMELYLFKLPQRL